MGLCPMPRKLLKKFDQNFQQKARANKATNQNFSPRLAFGFACTFSPSFLKVLGEEDVNFFAVGKERAGGGRFCKSALLLLYLSFAGSILQPEVQELGFAG